ncbi:hypothetical protein LAJLEIBI_02632 [[Clostridium] hylemonae DSM 15053]|nr:hypothetical protein LAJLEIBI_02632 [[Clostridium] hylemonae DSM 15053]
MLRLKQPLFARDYKEVGKEPGNRLLCHVFWVQNETMTITNKIH